MDAESTLNFSLRGLQKTSDFFIGIDSDGCVFDSMELKHKECFIPALIEKFELQPISKYIRQTWENLNLYSLSRGRNRFLGILDCIDKTMQSSEVQNRGFKPMDLSALRRYTQTAKKLSNDNLESYLQTIHSPEERIVLERALAWSRDVNERVRSMAQNIIPFPFVHESLDKIKAHADCIVISSTPTETVEHEWEKCQLKPYVQLIAGQEFGSKKEVLIEASANKYKDKNVLIMGDAPGEMHAAEACACLFYPIIPGKEELSWERFYNEALSKFFSGRFDESYQKTINREFLSALDH